jgi:hypothetical protein
MVQGVGRVWRPPAPRVERARPFSDEFWRVGPDKGTPIILVAKRSMTRVAGAAKRSRTCSPSACHTSLTHHISRMRVRARHRCLQYAIGAAAEVLRAGERAASSGERRVGDGAAPRAAAAARLGERTWVPGVHRHDAARHEHRSEHARQLSPALLLRGCESGPVCARAC